MIKTKFSSSFSLFLVLLVSNICIAQQANPIRLNQSGFYPNAPKLAVVVVSNDLTNFSVVDQVTKVEVFKGKLNQKKASRNSSLQTQTADFSALTKAGNYVLKVEGLSEPSYAFSIRERVGLSAAKSSLKAFYYQRVSMPLEERYAGKWQRPAGHRDDKILIHGSAADERRTEGTVISSPGGWYDAGDYNKYIVNSGITMGTMLAAYEDYREYFDTLNTNIPESGNKIPDFLDEVLYNLRWMLTMQDPADGGVYHKCTNASFDGSVMPGVTTLPRYAVQKGTAATLDFAAVTAQAARVYEKFGKQLPGLADSCLKASKAAWNWATKNPAIEYNQDSINKKFNPQIKTGAYGDKTYDDEWFWAASELYITTGGENYLETLNSELTSKFTLPSWNKVYLLGYYSLWRNTAKRRMPQGLTESIKTQLLDFANGYLDSAKTNAFQTPMGKQRSDFNWGSNSNAANQGILFLYAYAITNEKKYADAALANFDYLLGRNATGYCFLTGEGTRSTMHPHHRPSQADGIDAPVPGLLAGGPNPGRQDNCKYEFTEPETSYTDNDCSYASNEIAINWNAPFVYLSNAIEALQFKLGYSKK